MFKRHPHVVTCSTAELMERFSRARTIKRQGSYPYEKWMCLFCPNEIRRREFYRAVAFGITHEKVARCHEECYGIRLTTKKGADHEKQQISLG